MKLLLIDDEPIILQGLSIIIDWEKEGFAVVKTCNNPLQALEFLKENEVDLIISDIKMPNMSGIELAKKLKDEKISDAHFVILSGYSDFEFAKKAIEYQCLDYLLKPVQTDEILKVLNKVREHKKEEESKDNTRNFARNLIALIKGKYDEIDFEKVKEHLEIECNYRYIEIEINELLVDNKFSVTEKRQIQREIHKYCTLFLEQERTAVCVLDVSGLENRFEVGIVYKVEVETSEFNYFLNMKNFISEKIGMPVIILVGKIVHGLDKISLSYESTVLSLVFQSFDKNEGIVYFSEKPTQKENDVILCKKSIESLVKAIDKNVKEEIIDSVEKLFEDFLELKGSPEIIKININYLLFQLIAIAAKNNDGVSSDEIVEFCNSKSFELGTAWGSKKHLIEFAFEFGNYIKECRKKTSNPIIYDIEKYIKDNYAENISLKQLSKIYYVNSAYLGQLFKKYCGVSFKDYLNNCRIEKAMELLETRDMKVYEIAEAVGYKDVDYFIERFIAKVGCTPTKYRAKIISD